MLVDSWQPDICAFGRSCQRHYWDRAELKGGAGAVCGIAGILRTGERPLPPARVLRRMLATIEYRGPDDTGEFLSDDCQLGVVRLAIIDLKGGYQPVTSPDDQIVSVYNGEIYNYQDLMRGLRRGGRALASESDSSVLVPLYEQAGEELVNSLRGMFAFAIWDSRQRKLLMVRDRLGIKPLYWATTPDYLVFGSEIKVILASGLVEPQLDDRSVDDLFSLSYPCPPRTMFKGIYELRPAHLLSTRAGAPVAPPRRYWRASFAPHGHHRKGHFSDFAHELRGLLRERVYEHLQADVRVGAYLSGGLDSSAIAAVVKEVTGDAPVTFSIGFSIPEHDERRYSRDVARFLGSENHTVLCDPGAAYELPSMLWHTELPLQFPLALPLSRLSNLARQHGCPVVLTGEGADEILGGYDCFRAQKMRRLLDRPLLHLLRPFVYRQLYGWLGTPAGTVEAMLEVQKTPIDEVTRAFSGVFPPWYDVWRALDVERNLLLGASGRDVRPISRAPEEFCDLVADEVDLLHPLDAQIALELETRLPSWILLIGDRAGMSNSVETRVPFLDHEIIDFVASLPPSAKLRGFREKSLLRKAVSGLLPGQVARRRKKPFYTPIREWFFSQNRPEFVDDLLSEAALRNAGIFAPEVVKRLRQDLELVDPNTLMRHQLEWILFLVLNTQLLNLMFVENHRSLLH